MPLPKSTVQLIDEAAEALERMHRTLGPIVPDSLCDRRLCPYTLLIDELRAHNATIRREDRPAPFGAVIAPVPVLRQLPLPLEVASAG